MNKYKIKFQPYDKTFEIEEGRDILSFAIENGINIPSICNGEKLCGKCIIKILEGNVPPTHIETKFFSDIEIKDGLRLACKTKVRDNISVLVLNEEEVESIKILTTGLETPVTPKNEITKIQIKFNKPSLDNLKPYSECLLQSLPEEYNNLSISFDLLKDMSSILDKDNENYFLVIKDGEILNIETQEQKNYGLAFDIGTTTIVGLLVDLDTGKTVKVASRTNPQVVAGADVITRINYSINENDGLTKLQKLVISAINEIINELCINMNYDSNNIYSIALAGNAVMNHLLLGVNPKSMAFAPYVPVYHFISDIKAKNLSLNINPSASVYILPNISGFVGGDIVALILAHKLLETEKITLGIDIGTNGEIVVGSKKRLLCCATAAGPAFEGGHITFGMRAANGAIDSVSIEGDKILYHVIGNVNPKGICGTGLIDLIAALLEIGIIDETGRIVSPDEIDSVALPFKNRIRENGSQYEFVLVFKEEIKNGNDIVLKQQDVRELQLAKGAISAGYSVLLSELGLEEKDIDEVLIAGAFGSYIKKESAMRIGLLPKISLDKVKSIGNSSSIGAKQYLVSDTKRKESIEIVKNTEYIELCLRPDFQEKFMDSMIF
ncbi:MAG TPA: ASKHA domain-containing protein [Bacteroidota bacterium]|nr:ASKHA domain-containing protein [Bacteroidota bacterium]